jgi:ComF family protein
MRLSTGNKRGLVPRIIDYLYPSACPLCDSRTDTFLYAPLCSNCWQSIKIFRGPSCRICSTPFSSEHSDICGKCLIKKPPFSKVFSYGLYEGALSTAINLFKFQGTKRLSRPLGAFLLEIDVKNIDAVIPVPLSSGGLRERGFNQSLLLAKIYSEKKKVPLIINRLFKKKDTPPQLRLSAKERLTNLRNVFSVVGNFSGKRLLLVDDVMTTGATACECTKQLLKAGADEVIVITLARSSIM